MSGDGAVTAAHPATGHRDVDRGMRDLWRFARYEPVVVGGCRVPARLRAGLEFASEYRRERHIHTTITQ